MYIQLNYKQALIYLHLKLFLFINILKFFTLKYFYKKIIIMYLREKH